MPGGIYFYTWRQLFLYEEAVIVIRGSYVTYVIRQILCSLIHTNRIWDILQQIRLLI